MCTNLQDMSDGQTPQMGVIRGRFKTANVEAGPNEARGIVLQESIHIVVAHARLRLRCPLCSLRKVPVCV